MLEKKKSNSSKMKKGFLAVQVGLEENEPAQLHKFVIPIWYLYHPRFNGLLNRASEVYGYHVDGPLRLPCSVDDFIQIQRWIEQDGGSDKHRRHHPHPLFSNHQP
ncbi:hypothetical protein RND81_04G213400 [Saponaria officinalis]|uniref:Uncharacterized protein n=1 Tax=Saponaria officinalis TaxID=3572 RepID=A0AAW1LPD8_SAPOF